MTQQPTFLWTLADYERFLAHPEPDVRSWAKLHISAEYPDQAPHLLVKLLDDPDPLLHASAIEALGSQEDAESETKLLALLPQVDEILQSSITLYLARRQSALFLPILLKQVSTLDLQKPLPAHGFLDFTRVEALGEYTDPEVRAHLWHLIEGYSWDSHLQESAYKAQLRHPDATLLPRLLERLVQLKKVNEHEHASAWNAVAATVGQQQLFRQAIDDDALSDLLDSAAEWWGVSPFDANLLSAIGDNDAGEKLPPILAHEFQQQAAVRGDNLDEWLTAWQAGVQPVGYRQRTLASWQILDTLSQLSQQAFAPHHTLAVRTLAVIVLGQYLLDENDEQRLAAAENDEQRRTLLLELLASPRQNVRATLVEEVTALGPSIIPALSPILQARAYWSLERTLTVVTKIAQTQPGAADALMPALLDLLADDVGDFINEACEKAMTAIGPAMVEPLAARLTPENDTVEIYGIGVLADIPVQASVDALEHYIAQQQEIDSRQWENLMHLGHRQSIKFLRQFYDGQNPRLARTLHTLGLLHGLENEEMDAWAAVVKADQLARERSGFDLSAIQRSMGFTMSQPMRAIAPSQANREAAAGKARKKKREQAKATKKAQQKAKKKKKR